MGADLIGKIRAVPGLHGPGPDGSRCPVLLKGQAVEQPAPVIADTLVISQSAKDDGTTAA